MFLRLHLIENIFFLNKFANNNLEDCIWQELSKTILQIKLKFLGMTWDYFFSRDAIEILDSNKRFFSYVVLDSDLSMFKILSSISGLRTTLR